MSLLSVWGEWGVYMDVGGAERMQCWPPGGQGQAGEQAVEPTACIVGSQGHPWSMLESQHSASSLCSLLNC